MQLPVGNLHIADSVVAGRDLLHKRLTNKAPDSDGSPRRANRLLGTYVVNGNPRREKPSKAL